MAFGKRKKQFLDSSNVIEEQPLYNESESIHVQNESEPEIEEVPIAQEKIDPQKPLNSEVDFFGTSKGKNPGGAKLWRCKHCNKRFNSTYTRIHHHFFGYPPGKKPDIQRCQKMTTDQEAYRRLRNKVQQIEEAGTSSYLRSSNLTARDMPKPNTIVDAFATMDREAVDMKIMRFLCACATLFKAKSTKILLKVAKTRFACMYIMLKRMLDVREALATTIVTKAWRDWLAKQDVPTRNTGFEVVETINDEVFWDEVSNVIVITKPIWKLLKFCDGDGPKMGEIYERMDNLVGEVKDIMFMNKHKNEYDIVESILIERWNKMTIPLHCLAYALCPRFYDPKYLEAPAPGGFTRKTPNLDREVMKGCMDAFEKIGENSTEKQMLRDQFVDFQMKKGMFSLPQSKTDAVVLEAIEWWSLYDYPCLEDSPAELEDLRWQSLDGDFDEEGGRNASGSSAQVEESVTKRPRIDQ
ncbi:Toll-like receptor 4, partial [Bienertia sinuspersici]